MISSLGTSRPRFLDLATPSGREGKEEGKDGKEEGTGGRMAGVAKDIHTHIHPVDLGVGGAICSPPQVNALLKLLCTRVFRISDRAFRFQLSKSRMKGDRGGRGQHASPLVSADMPLLLFVSTLNPKP